MIRADCINSGLQTYLFHKPPKGHSSFAPIAPLIGLSCFLSGIWFLFGMPVVTVIYAWKFWRSRRMSTGVLVSAVMLIAFFVTAELLWRDFSAHYWNLSFGAAFAAAGDSARYGNPVEDTSESVLLSLLVLSTFAAAAAGIVAGVARTFWARRQRRQA